MKITRTPLPRLGAFSSDFSRCLDTGEVTNNSTHVRALEEALGRILDVPVLCFNSGQSALTAMMLAADLEGGEVICPSFTFVGTAHAVVMAGGKPVFADIDPITLCLDPDDVERKVTSKTRAILGVDPYGVCWEPPKHWQNGDIPLYIDAAPAFGSTPCLYPLAKRGRACIFSFHQSKPFSTMEGGCVASDDAEFMKRIAQIRVFGQDETGDVHALGMNGKMCEVNALVGLRQLDTWQYRATHRIESALRLRHALRTHVPHIRAFHAPLGQECIWTYQPVFVEPEFGVSRETVLQGLRDRGVMARAYYRPVHHLAMYLDPSVKLPVTERLAASVIALPVYDEMTDAEIQQIVNAFREMQK